MGSMRTDAIDIIELVKNGLVEDSHEDLIQQVEIALLRLKIKAQLDY
jgi:hypothetical protein